jgi:hypothetical protein
MEIPPLVIRAAEDNEAYAIFGRVDHMLSALHVCGGDSMSRFPSWVVEAPERHWAIPLRLIENSRHLPHLARQHGWDVQVAPAKPAGRDVPFRDCLKDIWAWTYRDPNETDPDPEPRASENTYLLGARDVSHAQEILNMLTDLLTWPIHAVPFLLTGVGQVSPYQYFWLVNMDRPALTVLRSAQRAWEGPLGIGSSVQIFEHWPYSLRIPPEHLHRIDWGSETSFVLLSPEPPKILLLRRPKDAPDLAELLDASDLCVPRSDNLEPVILHGGASPLRFRVDVKLVEEDPRSALAHRIELLNEEISVKSQVRSWMEKRGSIHEEESPFFEPLFFYSAPPGEIPFELRRILLEWSDQAQDLRALCYQKLDTSSLPEGIFPKGHEVHALTTPNAIGGSSPTWLSPASELSLRLREYAPSSPNSSFDLVPGWDQFGLKLFVPHGQRPALYPMLEPSRVAAEKLAKAFGMPRDGGAAVLIQPVDKPLRTFRLSLAGFRPLLESFEWDCAFDFSVDAAAAAVPMAAEIRERVMRSVEQDVTLQVRAEAHLRLGAITKTLLARLDTLAQETEDRKQVVAKQQEAAAEHQRLLDELNAFMSRISAGGVHLWGAVDEMEAHINWATAKLQEIKKRWKRIREREKELETYNKNIGHLEEILSRTADIKRTRE